MKNTHKKRRRRRVASSGVKRCAVCGRFVGSECQMRMGKCCCGSEPCLKALKREYNRQWNDRHPGYFEGRYESNTKVWRAKHPDYQRERRKRRRGEIQERDGAQAFEKARYLDIGVRVVSKGGEIQVNFPRQIRFRRGNPPDGFLPMSDCVRYKNKTSGKRLFFQQNSSTGPRAPSAL